jgi:predicted nucleic acid-binding protein
VAKRKTASTVERAEPAAVRYIESSALVAALLEHDVQALKSIRSAERTVTSALTIAETARAILRARLAGRLTADEERAAVRALHRFERRCHLAAVTDAILARAGRRFSIEPIRNLDAVHLATTELLGEPASLVTVVTRDVRVRQNAEALGYRVE